MTSDPKMQVISLGLGRTGTKSLKDALEILGFGPCYHMSTILEGRTDLSDFDMWGKIGDGNATKEEIRTLLKGYGSVTDYPAAIYGPELYSTFPDAKYILSIRDPAKWEKSIKSTLLRILQVIRESPGSAPTFQALLNWCDKYMINKYHRGRMATHAQQEILDHNERVKQLIPPENLLIYEVGEGWDRLAEFLGVPIPTVPFPHINDSEQFQMLIELVKSSAGQNQAA